MKKKICFIVQRYGIEVNGGSETYCRQVAEHLAPSYEVDVLTTTALGYITWENHFTAGIEIINGVTVHRFPVERERNIEEFAEKDALLSKPTASYEDGLLWLKSQGPFAPALVDYAIKHAHEYDVFIGVTYLYYPTAMFLLGTNAPVVFIPTAHDEPPIYQPIFEKVFYSAASYFYLTPEEKKFTESRFPLLSSKSCIDEGGIGIEVVADTDPEAFKARYNLEEYLLYIGRIEPSKGCQLLFYYFLEYKKTHKDALKLVLMGKPEMEIPDDENIISLGFVSEKEKFDGIAGALALVQSSPFESLSIVTLEALALKTPVLVNGECSVLKGHCQRSRAGLYYQGSYEFSGLLDYLRTHEEERLIMGENGQEYVANNYTWENTISKMHYLIEKTIMEHPINESA